MTLGRRARCAAYAGLVYRRCRAGHRRKTFFWEGKYGWDLNTRETIDTQLNVFEHFEPKLSPEARASEVLFLANIQPGLQLDVRQQCAGARFVALDSMNLWIDIARDELLEAISRIDCLILNDEELRQLTQRPNLVSAAREILAVDRRSSSPSRASTARR